jgi:hypothetical protein
MEPMQSLQTLRLKNFQYIQGIFPTRLLKPMGGKTLLKKGKAFLINLGSYVLLQNWEGVFTLLVNLTP